VWFISVFLCFYVLSVCLFVCLFVWYDIQGFSSLCKTAAILAYGGDSIHTISATLLTDTTGSDPYDVLQNSSGGEFPAF